MSCRRRAAPTPGRGRLTRTPAGEAAGVRPFASFCLALWNADVVGDDGQVNPEYLVEVGVGHLTGEMRHRAIVDIRRVVAEAFEIGAVHTGNREVSII